MKPKPPCTTIFAWLKSNLGKNCLATLTGTDAKALHAAVQIIELYTWTGTHQQGVLDAFRFAVLCMQPRTRELAYHAIAHVMDWNDRDEVWERAGLPHLNNIRVCSFGPGGSHIDLSKSKQ